MKKGCIGLIVLGVIALALFGWVKMCLQRTRGFSGER